MVRLMILMCAALVVGACSETGIRIAGPDGDERAYTQRYIEFCQRC